MAPPHDCFENYLFGEFCGKRGYFAGFIASFPPTLHEFCIGLVGDCDILSEGL